MAMVRGGADRAQFVRRNDAVRMPMRRFLFVTGYTRESLPEAFGANPAEAVYERAYTSIFTGAVPCVWDPHRVRRFNLGGVPLADSAGALIHSLAPVTGGGLPARLLT